MKTLSFEKEIHRYNNFSYIFATNLFIIYTSVLINAPFIREETHKPSFAIEPVMRSAFEPKVTLVPRHGIVFFVHKS